MFETVASAVPPWAHAMQKQIIITLTNGTTIETDAIFSIDFDVDRMRAVIRGWKEGLNQTLDEIKFSEIRRIEFPRDD